jgi:hypothetical protein
MTRLAMLVIFHVNVITLSNFQFTIHLSHLCCKNWFFWNENFQINHMVCKHGSKYVKWHGPLTFTKTKSFKCFLEYIRVFEYISTLHLFPEIYSNFPFYKMKWNSFFFNILLKLRSNIICKYIAKLFQKCEVGFIQTVHA